MREIVSKIITNFLKMHLFAQTGLKKYKIMEKKLLTEFIRL